MLSPHCPAGVRGDDATINGRRSKAMTPRSPTAELEINLNRLDAASYSVDLRSRRPRSEVDIAPVRGTITFDFPKLESSRFDGAEAAGKALSDCLFSDTDIRSHYKRLCDDADRDDAVLRVRLFIGASAAGAARPQMGVAARPLHRHADGDTRASPLLEVPGQLRPA